MVEVDPAQTADPAPPSLARLRQIGLDAGLSSVGATSAQVLEPARSILPLRRAAGLASTMQFTYRNPDRSTDPGRTLEGAQSLIVGLLDYRRAERSTEIAVAGRVARYSWRDHYEDLRAGLGEIAAALTASGYRARVVADSNALVDRNAAWRAGLGWYGKNTNLLVPGSGSWFVMGAVITDAVIDGDDVPVADGCGSCTACLDDCPTAALVAPGVLDARRCIAWLVQAAEPIPAEFRVAVGDWIYGCDICQEVCPPNKVSFRRSPPAPPEPEVQDVVDVTWVLAASDAELLDECGRWYIANRDPDVIRRTALVVLGNVASSSDNVTQELLDVYLHHESALLRAHAVWAARRLGLGERAEHTKADPDALVRSEWEHPVDERVTAPAGEGAA